MTVLKNINFMDKFVDYFNNVYDKNDIQKIVISHINLKELDEKIKRKKKEEDNPKTRKWKRESDTNNIYKNFIDSKNTIDIKNKNKNKKNCSNKNIKITYSNNKRSVLYKKN